MNYGGSTTNARRRRRRVSTSSMVEIVGHKGKRGRELGKAVRLTRRSIYRVYGRTGHDFLQFRCLLRGVFASTRLLFSFRSFRASRISFALFTGYAVIAFYFSEFDVVTGATGFRGNGSELVVGEDYRRRREFWQLMIDCFAAGEMFLIRSSSVLPLFLFEFGS